MWLRRLLASKPQALGAPEDRVSLGPKRQKDKGLPACMQTASLNHAASTLSPCTRPLSGAAHYALCALRCSNRAAAAAVAVADAAAAAAAAADAEASRLVLQQQLQQLPTAIPKPLR
ncbi:hypothetical protein Emag_005678 [Eimeria magna]